eukprot:4619846-Prymnesium_polylepis.1
MERNGILHPRRKFAYSQDTLCVAGDPRCTPKPRTVCVDEAQTLLCVIAEHASRDTCPIRFGPHV